MKGAHLKLFLIVAIFAGIANVDSTAITNSQASISAPISRQSVSTPIKKRIDLIGIGQTIEVVNVIKAKAIDPSIVAANISPIAADLRIIESRVALKDIDIQASLPIIL